MQNLQPTTPTASTLVYPFKMKVEPGRVRGQVSDFREGMLTITPQGIHVDGKTLLPRGKRILIILLCLVLLWGALVAAVVVEHLIRFKASLELSWDCVDEIVLEPRKNRICLVYHRPDDPRRQYSLAFYQQPAMFQYFSEVARYFGKEKVREATIGPAEDWRISLAIIVAFFVGIGLLILVTGGR